MKALCIAITGLLVMVTPTQSQISVGYCTPVGGNSIGVGFTTSGFTPVNGTLFFRNGGQRTYHSTPITVTGNQVEGTIPPEYANLKGLEYYVILSDGSQQISYPVTDPVNRPAVARVDISHLQAGITLTPLTYRMVSVPATLRDNSIAGVFADDFGPYTPSKWRVFRFEQNAYAEFSAITARMTPGVAVWLITEDGRPFDIDDARSLPSDSSVVVTLQDGWNQIANPFAFPVAWDSVQGSGNVTAPVFYNGTEFQPNVRVLQPWEGYFVHVVEGATLRFFPVEAPPSLGRSAAPRASSPGEFAVSMIAEVPGTSLRDSYNIMGTLAGAEDGVDRLDVPEPPPIGDFIQLTSVESGMGFMSNFKGVRPDGQSWDLQVRSSRTTGLARLSLQTGNPLPDGFSVHVLDIDEGSAIALTGNQFHVALTGASPRNLQLVVGTKEFAEQTAHGIPLTPVEFGLDANFPNPFNPTTTIRYTLGARRAVQLEIFNLVGQKIRTLVNEEQGAGTHTVSWNGKNDNGRDVASGVFLYRLKAGEFSATRRLILLR